MAHNTTKGKVERTVSLDSDQIKQIKQIAVEEGTNFSIVIRQLVKQALAARNGK